MREKEGGLDVGNGLNLWVVVSFGAISYDSYVEGLLLMRQSSSIRMLDDVP